MNKYFNKVVDLAWNEWQIICAEWRDWRKNGVDLSVGFSLPPTDQVLKTVILIILTIGGIWWGLQRYAEGQCAVPYGFAEAAYVVPGGVQCKSYLHGVPYYLTLDEVEQRWQEFTNPGNDS